MIITKIKCPICNYEIGSNNYKRHIKICIGKKPQLKNNQTYKLDHDDLDCKFCQKQFLTTNALIQHEIRCKLNPNRKNYNSLGNWSHNNLLGQTKDTNEIVAKYTNSTKISRERGNFNYNNSNFKQKFTYIYEEHNNNELQKWFDYVNTIIVNLNYIKTIPKNNDSYITITIDSSSMFEHVYIMSFYVNLLAGNTIHHIDRNKQNNSIYNLITFETVADHKRFHISKNSKLIYNEITHKFTCEIKKE